MSPMWWLGLIRSARPLKEKLIRVCGKKEESDDPTQSIFQTRSIGEDRNALQRRGRRHSRSTDRALPSLSGDAPECGTRIVGLAWIPWPIPGRPDAARDLSKPHRQSIGWRDRENPLLGCPVRWFPQSGLFMCPCHGGAYYSDGSRASGPPERGLFEYRYTLKQGNLLVHAGQMPTTGVPVARLTNISLDKPPCA